MLDEKLCNGCAACSNACPVNAISMVRNNEGFLYPKIDSSICINCGLCDKICEAEVAQRNKPQPDCYAAMASDEIRKESSSGGVFTILANYVLQKDGYVCGCTFDISDLKAKHIIINKQEDLHKLRGSKYIQSQIGSCYKDIKALLEQGSLVLFSGTPCQVAGLQKFLQKSYENLLTVDILCHGVPSPKVYQKHLNELCKSSNEKFLNINFRNKEYGWEPQFTTTTTTTTTTTYTFKHTEDVFLEVFLKNICLRKSCTSCQYCTTQRAGDFTIGDFWRIDYFYSELNDKKGTSLLLTNNPKAEHLLNKIKNNFKKIKKVPLKYAIAGNKNLYSPHKCHPKRELFFENLEKYSLKQLANMYLHNKYECGIMNCWASWNYGAILTCFALQEVIKSLGYTTQVINFRHKIHENKRNYPRSNAQKDFVKKYFNLTQVCKNKKQLSKLNKTISTFISGSDQVWSWYYPMQYLYFFDFVKSDKKKIACAAGMCFKNFQQPDDVKTALEYYMKRFDAVSMREKQSVDFCKKEFDINATFILDPVFLLPKSTYENLIKESSLNKDKFIVIYMFEYDKHIKKMAERLAEQSNCEIIHIKQGQSIQDWLYYIKNAEFVITDSFHGTCFSIIFEKQFIVPINNYRGNERFESILSCIGLTDKFFTNKTNTEMLLNEINKPINYNQINSILQNEINKSLTWLNNALSSPKNKFKEPIESRIIDMLLRNNNRIPKGIPNSILKIKRVGYSILKQIYINIRINLFLITGYTKFLG